MWRAIKLHIKKILDLYPRWLCRQEFESQTFTRFNERPVEYGFVFRMLAELYPYKILDIGTGITALPHLMRNCGFLVTATDNINDYWPSAMDNRHYHIINDDITNTHLNDKFDLITCISVLEHIENSDAAIRNMFTLLNPNGHLILTFPYNERNYIRNVYDLPSSIYYGQGALAIAQSYSRADLNRWLQDNQAKIIEQEYWQYWSEDHWTIGSQIIPPKMVSAENKHQLSCILIQRKA